MSPYGVLTSGRLKSFRKSKTCQLPLPLHLNWGRRGVAIGCSHHTGFSKYVGVQGLHRWSDDRNPLAPVANTAISLSPGFNGKGSASEPGDSLR